MRLSWTVVSIALAIGAAVCFVGFMLFAGRIDGEREKVRERGGHPVTDGHGDVKDAAEDGRDDV